MDYQIELKPRAIKDLTRLPKPDAIRMVIALEALANNLAGDVKKLTCHTPEYRLRVGNYRALFEIVNADLIVVYRIGHRREIYR